MKLSRASRLTGLALGAALVVTACGTDENTDTTAATGSSAPSSAVACGSGSLTGAGSSAQKNAVDEWVKGFQSQCSGANVNYQSVGSGAGIEQFIAGTVDFAGSDSALKPEEQPKADARCATGKAINLPMVVGPVAVAYNLQGVEDLVLDGPTIAKIFAGKITKWDDAAIQALNPDAKLPSTGVQAFHRSDSSGTTDNFTKYLVAAAGADWTYDKGKEWKAPGGQGAKGSDGVAAGVKQTDGGIGYMELSFVENAGLKAAKIDTGAGEPVELTTDAASTAVEAAEVKGTGSDLALSIDYATKAAGAYPIVLVTYEIVCEKGTAADKLELLKSFLTYTSSEAGQSAIAEVGYAPLPASIVEKVRTSVGALS